MKLSSKQKAETLQALYERIGTLNTLIATLMAEGPLGQERVIESFRDSKNICSSVAEILEMEDA